METIHQLIGRELPLDDVNRALKSFVMGFRPPVVGAMHITCADESEKECVDSFQSRFVQSLLPTLKLAQQSSFRLANLGARYEWGAVRIAEDHYATPESQDSFKVLLVKVNSHVSVESTPEGLVFGKMDRYKTSSEYCGALHATMKGSHQRFVGRIREVFGSEGKDRLKILLDPEKVDPTFRALFAAAAMARLQSRRVALDIQDHKPASPTLYFVLPCVTLNRKNADSEILCGVYTSDRRDAHPVDEYYGFGDDPSKYQLGEEWGKLLLHEGTEIEVRPARDHRALVLHEYERRFRNVGKQDDRLDEALVEAAQKKKADPQTKKVILKTLLRLLADLNPISASLFLFAEGVADIQHIFRVQRLAKEMAGDEEARKILDSVHAQVDGMPSEKAQRIIEILTAEFGTARG